MAMIASLVVPTSLFRWCPRSLFLLTQAKIIILIRRPKVSGLRSGQQLLEISEVLHNSCHPLPGKNCSTTCRVIVNILPATSNRRPTHNVRQQGGVLSHASGRAEVGMIQQLRSHTHQILSSSLILPPSVSWLLSSWSQDGCSSSRHCIFNQVQQSLKELCGIWKWFKG